MNETAGLRLDVLTGYWQTITEEAERVGLEGCKAAALAAKVRAQEVSEQADSGNCAVYYTLASICYQLAAQTAGDGTDASAFFAHDAFVFEDKAFECENPV